MILHQARSNSVAVEESKRTPTRSACIASTPAVPLSCNSCTLISTRPSSLSWPSCGRQASSDHRNPIACGHTDAFLARRGRPDGRQVLSQCSKRCVRGAIADLSSFVLGDFVLRMLLAILAFTVRASRFRYVDLFVDNVLASINTNVPTPILPPAPVPEDYHKSNDESLQVMAQHDSIPETLPWGLW